MTQTQMQVRCGAVPGAASIARLYERVDLADAYSITLPPDAAHDPERLARWMFERPAPWMTWLMGIRDMLVAAFGLKTARSLQAPAMPDSQKRIGMFQVYFQDAHEIVLGEDDRHLDFRISVLLQLSAPPQGRTTLVVSTVVHCHNRLGRSYLKLIAPFHRLIVRATLRRAARAGWPRLHPSVNR